METIKSVSADESVKIKSDSRFFPDVVLRSQFFELDSARRLSSEQALMLAVLADAINVVTVDGGSASPGKRSPFNEAWAWIFSKGVRSDRAPPAIEPVRIADRERIRRRFRSIA